MTTQSLPYAHLGEALATDYFQVREQFTDEQWNYFITLTTTALSKEAGRAREVVGQFARKDGRRRSLDPERRRRLTAALATVAATTGILVAGITFAEAVTDEPVSDWGRDGGSGSRSGDQAPAHESATPTDTTARRSRPGGAAVAAADGFGHDSHGDPDRADGSDSHATAPSASPTAAPSPAALP